MQQITDPFARAFADSLASQRNGHANEAALLAAQLQLAQASAEEIQQQVAQLQGQLSTAEKGRVLAAQIAAQFGRVARGEAQSDPEALDALWAKLSEMDPDTTQ